MKKVALDTETTGVEPGSRMVELAAILFDESGQLGVFKSLVNPGMPMPADAGKVNGFTDDMLKDAPNAGEVLAEFFAWLPCDELVAHYAQYDTGIISWEADRFGIEIPDLTVTCTCEIAKSIGATKNNKLVTVADHYQLERIGEDHRAISDAHLCVEYYSLIHSQINPERALPWSEAGHDYAYTDDFPESLELLPLLVGGGTPLAFKYVDAKDKVTERTITPYGWASVNNVLMFHGHCHMRDARRTFRADRVKEVSKGEEVEAA